MAGKVGMGAAGMWLVLLCVENVTSTMMRRYAIGELKLNFNKSSVLMVNEMMKLVFSLVMIYRTTGQAKYGARLHRVATHALPMAVPAFLYLVVNWISYPALARLPASVFNAISQLKILCTAFCATIMLGQRISGRKWRTLVLLLLGVLLISTESAPASAPASAHHQSVERSRYMQGIAMAAVQTLLSSFCSVYFEKYLKAKTAQLGIWDRNVQLSFFSVAIYLPMSFVETGGNIFDGWSPIICCLACLHAAGGILVALSVLTSSSVSKTVAVSGGLVMTTFLGNYLFSAPLDTTIALGCAVTIMSIFQYRDDCLLESQHTQPQHRKVSDEEDNPV